MQRLIDEGAYGPLRTDRPTKSAIIWNSIATGKTMLKHGIIDWTYASETGLEVPYTDRKRRVKTYWEILDERGFKTGTLNWWVSYPPVPAGATAGSSATPSRTGRSRARSIRRSSSTA